MTSAHGVVVEAVPSAEAAVRGSDVVITATPSRQPVVLDAWVQPGMHVTAIGSDVPGKCELEPAILARARVVADSLRQCLTQGEIHHAVEAGAIGAGDVHAELGEVAAGLRPGRGAEDEITVADLTGVGVLDAAVSSVVVERAGREGIGRLVEV
jgi:ornithine cyclodeaminase